MKLATRLFGQTYTFKDVKEVLAKANEPRSGDVLAGIAAHSAQERIAAKHVLSELLRIADRAVVSLPNFGHWRVRLDLLTKGRMPETKALPEPWWSTPNIHLCTLRDFTALCEDLELRIDACASLVPGKPARQIDPMAPIENWRAENALFLLSRKAEPAPPSTPAPPPGDLFE